MDRITLFNKIKNHKPDLSESSIKVYVATLANTGKELDFTSPNQFATRYKEVIKYLATLPAARAKNICSAILALVTDKKSVKAYKDFIIDVSEAVRKSQEEQKKSAAQEENWESWSDIMKTYNQLKQEADALFEKEKLTHANLKILRDYVILSFYTLIPPRRIKDYIDFKTRNIDKDKDNYWDKENHQLVFNSYKTSKNYGQQRVDAPKALEEVFEKWYPIAQQFSDYVLFNGYGEKMAQPVLTKTINNIFGKKISASMLRHIYVSDVVLKDAPKISELDDIARDMGHSRDQQMLYKKF